MAIGLFRTRISVAVETPICARVFTPKGIVLMIVSKKQVMCPKTTFLTTGSLCT
jgi:hypothetical protein